MEKKKEHNDEWVIINFRVEPSVKKKYESIITLKGYKTLSESFREHMRNVVNLFDKEQKNA